MLASPPLVSNAMGYLMSGYAALSAGAVAVLAQAPVPAPLRPEVAWAAIITAVFSGASGLLILILNARKIRQDTEARIAEARIAVEQRLAERKLDNDDRFIVLTRQIDAQKADALVELRLRAAERDSYDRTVAELRRRLALATSVSARQDVAIDLLATATGTDLRPPSSPSIPILPEPPRS